MWFIQIKRDKEGKTLIWVYKKTSQSFTASCSRLLDANHQQIHLCKCLCNIKRKMKSAAAFVAIACLVLAHVQGGISNFMLQITIIALSIHCVTWLYQNFADFYLQDNQGPFQRGVRARVLWLMQFIAIGLTRLKFILQVQLVRMWKLCTFNNFSYPTQLDEYFSFIQLWY